MPCKSYNCNLNKLLNFTIMKKLFIVLSVFILIFTSMICSCNNKSNNNNEETIECDDKSNIDEETLVKDFLSNLYSNYVFGNNDFDDIKTHFSQSIVNQLRDEFEYDGGGYAVWLFRSGAQDGPSQISRVNNISLLSDGWYKVEMTDMGYDVSCRFKVSVEDGAVFVTAFENSDYSN